MKILIEIPEVRDILNVKVLANPGLTGYSTYFNAKVLKIDGVPAELIGKPMMPSLTKEELVSKIEKLNVNDSWRIFLEEIIRRLP